MEKSLPKRRRGIQKVPAVEEIQGTPTDSERVTNLRMAAMKRAQGATVQGRKEVRKVSTTVEWTRARVRREVLWPQKDLQRKGNLEGVARSQLQND